MGVYGKPLDSSSKMKSANNMRGQLGTRSSALSPTSSKLTTQYLVLDHMTNHYNKITKARSAIDNKPPKSMLTSQKARDRKLRDYVDKTGVRPVSGMSNRPRRPYTSYDQYNDDIYDERLWGDPSDEEEKVIHDIMRTTLKGHDPGMTQGRYDPQQTYSNAVHIPSQSVYAQHQRPSSARSHRSMGSAAGRTVIQGTAKKGTFDGDVLQKHAQVFTEEKPFTPRTLKTDRVSRLSQYKYYNKPPPKGPKAAPPVQQNVAASETKPKESAAPPKPKPRNRKLSDTQEGNVTENSLMFETLHTRDYSKFDSDRDERVPKLDISMDTDHMNWIKDQASKAQFRAKSGTLKSSIREDEAYDTTVDFGKTGEMSLTYGTLGSTTKARPIEPSGMRSSRLSKEEEDAKYIQFMKDITNEVLNRGIYTDRALRQVFKTHIARRKGDLDELRMHQCCDQIRTELNIPRYDLQDDTTFTHDTAAPVPHHGADLHLHTKTSVEPSTQDRYQLEVAALNGTLDASMRSRTSKASSGHLDTSHVESHDTYNFKSTGSEDMFSTIRSDANNNATLSDTQALREYQQTISQQDNIVVRDESESEGEVHYQEPVHQPEAAPKPVQRRVQEPIRQKPSVPIQVKAVIHGEPAQQETSAPKPVQDITPHEQDDVMNGIDKTVDKHRAPTPLSQQQSEMDDYEDDYDEYDDDGDDEDGDGDYHQNTDPTATYRTDDDDF